MGKTLDLTGQRFGKLSVLCKSGYHNGKIMWRCVCDCGNETTVYGGSLRSGNTKSCGCINAKQNPRYKHGLSKTRLYHSWNAMMQRCNNPKDKRYANYGGRGISVCKEWQDFMTFRDWALSNGYASDLSIDRIDVNGNYCPENCRWATRIEQANNTTRNHYVTYNGETHTVAEWARLLGIDQSSLRKYRQ